MQFFGTGKTIFQKKLIFFAFVKKIWSNTFVYFIARPSMALQTKTAGHIILALSTLSTMIYSTSLADDFLFCSVEKLNIRTAPTLKGQVIGQFSKGDKVVIGEKSDNGWFRVIFEDGKEGYSYGEYLTNNRPYVAKALGSQYTVAAPRAFVRGDNLNKKVAVVHQGDLLTVVDNRLRANKWIRVEITSPTFERYRGRYGYIAKQLIEVVPGTEYQIEEEETYSNYGMEENVDNTQSSDTSTDMSTDTSESDLFNSAPASGDEESEVLKLLGDTGTSGTSGTTGGTTGTSTGTTGGTTGGSTGGTEDSLDLEKLLGL